MTNTTLVRLDRVTKVYPGPDPVHALRGISTSFLVGTLSLVQGPSGSGKTTLLSLLGGLDRPTSGRVRAFGTELTNLSAAQLAAYRRRDVGFVFQDFKLLDVLTAAENVALPLRVRRVGKTEARRRALDVLTRLGIGDRARSRPGELSGGEKQRLAIARALVTEPRLVLADEPTANLDGQSGEAVIELLHRATRHRATTVVVVSHDYRLCAHADLVLRLIDGRITMADLPEVAA